MIRVERVVCENSEYPSEWFVISDHNGKCTISVNEQSVMLKSGNMVQFVQMKDLEFVAWPCPDRVDVHINYRCNGMSGFMSFESLPNTGIEWVGFDD